MKRELKFGALLFAVLIPLGAAAAGMLLASGLLHPMRKPLTAEHVAYADRMTERTGATREDFTVIAPDNAKLHGWKFRAKEPNGDWVLLFHGVSDNRTGVLGHAEVLLRNGYSMLAMDARAHGSSEGDKTTYGWLERHDTRAIVEQLYASEPVHHLYALGASMGASIALQSASVEPRIEAVVAESAFANFRDIALDYVLRFTRGRGSTVLRPALSVVLGQVEKENGIEVDEISPEKAVGRRPFPVLLICGMEDRNVPCHHTQRIYDAASGPKELWLVPGAGHTAALGTAPEEFEHRVTEFFGKIHSKQEAGK
jgi:hypothetical protein